MDKGNVIKGNGFRMAYLVFLAVFLGGCATIRSGSHYDETASFEGYRTFSWIADDPLIVGADEHPTVSPLTRKKIVDAIAGELTRRGFVYTADRDAADFVLSYTIGTRERIEASSYPSVYRGTWGWHLYGRYYYDAEIVHRMYTEGTLGVDVFDGRTKQPVWHGWATKTISTSDREDPTPSIQRAVTALFARFPPGAG